MDVEFHCGDYASVDISDDALVYCDIPYKNTKPYKTPFDYQRFYDWARTREFRVIVGEYKLNVPEGASIIWQQDSSRCIRGHGSDKTTEVLFEFK